MGYIADVNMDVTGYIEKVNVKGEGGFVSSSVGSYFNLLR